MRRRTPTFRIHAAAASSLLLAACAVGPRWHAPQAPPNAGYAPTPLPQTGTSAPIHGGEAQQFLSGRDIPFEWWKLFQSPALNSLIEKAFKANSTIQAAQATLRQAEEMVYAQRGFFYPTIDANYQFERQKLAGNLSGSSAPGVQGDGTAITAVQNPPPIGPPFNQPLYFNFHTAQVTVGYVPDVFGSNRRQVESLVAQADAQRFNLEATYTTLASNVAAAAIQEASVRAQIAATEQIIDADEKALKILREQFRLGYTMRIDVAAQETALAQAELALPPLTKQLEQTRDLIRALVGNLPNEDVTETFELDSLVLPAEIPVSLPAKLIEQRPDVRAAEAQLHSANAQVGVAVAAMLPQFNITGAYGGTATHFHEMFSSGGPFWSLIADASQPLFHGGTLLHQKRAAEEQLQFAAAQYRTTVISAYQNVADTLHAALSDAQMLAAAANAEAASKVTLDLTQRQMQAGYVNYLGLLSAETAYSQAVLARIQAQASRFGDTVALFQALGGGWWNRTANSSTLNTDPQDKVAVLNVTTRSKITSEQ
ncbi:MAG TPA: efflux transporter outer membrane subunit [Candidatus Binataceae bacterium]|nr:efflux transporter outer membrane subunit [Candidatus Binataceae bacterium]